MKNWHLSRRWLSHLFLADLSYVSSQFHGWELYLQSFGGGAFVTKVVGGGDASSTALRILKQQPSDTCQTMPNLSVVQCTGRRRRMALKHLAVHSTLSKGQDVSYKSGSNLYLAWSRFRPEGVSWTERFGSRIIVRFEFWPGLTFGIVEPAIQTSSFGMHYSIPSSRYMVVH